MFLNLRAATLKGFTMKSVALALALLLAVGSQARPLQSDAPSKLESFKALAMMSLIQMKLSAQRALGQLDGTDYAPYKVMLSGGLDKLQEYALTASHSLAPYGSALKVQFQESTDQIRQSVMAEVEDVRTRLGPNREVLDQLLQKHAAEYRTELEPVFREYMVKGREAMGALGVQLQPLINDVRTNGGARVEEIKSEVIPMIDVIRNTLTERMSGLKTAASPYVTEYKDRLFRGLVVARAKLTPHIQALQTKLEPHRELMKKMAVSFHETVVQAMEE